MKRPAKIAVAVLATIGGAYVLFGIYASFFLMDCVGSTPAQAISPNQKYQAAFTQVSCKDPAKSRSQVELRGVKENVTQIVVEINGTSDVDLTWREDRELQVLVPESASIKKQYASQPNWPVVTVKRK
jgi:hypothetical protein